MPKANGAHSTGSRSCDVIRFAREPSPPVRDTSRQDGAKALTWCQLIWTIMQAERRLADILDLSDLPPFAAAQIELIGVELLAPTLRRDGRKPLDRWPTLARVQWNPACVSARHWDPRSAFKSDPIRSTI
jgi:hypothetical protein